MADCIRIRQSLQGLCCDDTDVTGQVRVELKGPINQKGLQLFDVAEEKWITPGVIGVFLIGEEEANAWITCPLPCLNQLNGPAQVPAYDLGFYYEFIVSVDGEETATYSVGLDCALLSLVDGQIANLEDVILLTPIAPTPNPNEIFVNQFETVTTITQNLDGTYTYTNEAGNEFTMVVGTGGGGDSHPPVTLIDNGNGTFTFTNEVGDQTSIDFGGAETITSLVGVGRIYTFTNEAGVPVSFDGGPQTITTIANNPTARTFTYTNESGVGVTVNYGDIVTNLVDNGDGTFTYTNEAGNGVTFDGSSCSPFEEILCDVANGGAPVYVTGIINPATGGFRVGPIYTRPDGTPYSGSLTNLTVCGGSGSGGIASCGSCSIDSLADVVITAPTNGQIVFYDSAQGAWVNGSPSILGGETITTLIAGSNGTMVYTNEAGIVTTFKTVDRERVIFSSDNLVTLPSSSALDINDISREIYAYAVTVSVAPVANETFSIVDFTNSVTIASGTLNGGSNTTGIVNITPYTLTAGSLLQANILTANESEKFTMYVFYRTNSSELGV